MVVDAVHVPVQMVFSERISDHRRIRFGHQKSAIRNALILGVGYPAVAFLVICYFWPFFFGPFGENLLFLRLLKQNPSQVGYRRFGL